jgi:Ras-related protein Rab-18
VYDITARDSFENLQHWLSEVDVYSTNESCVKMLIANKSDQAASRTVSKKEGQAFAREHNMLFIEASAKTQDGIQQAFDELLQKILDVPALLEEEGSAGAGSGSGSASMRLDRDAGQPRAGGGGSCGGFCA